MIKELVEIKVSLTRFIINTLNVANTDDTDEYLKISKITTQVNINSKDSWIESAVMMPRYVATPFPPLNLSQNGNTWPKNARRNDNSIKLWKKFIQIKTGR